MVQDLTNFSKYDVTDDCKVIRNKDGLEIKGWLGKNGYRVVGLTDDDGKKHKLYLHRVIAIKHLPKVDGKPFINHKDGDKTNNNIENLEWCTHQENIQHAYKTGLVSGKQCKFSDDEYYDMALNVMLGKETLTEASERLGTGVAQLSVNVRRVVEYRGLLSEYEAAAKAIKGDRRKANFKEYYIIEKICPKTLEVLETFTSYRELEEKLKLKSTGSIANACNTTKADGSRRQSLGFYWNKKLSSTTIP